MKKDLLYLKKLFSEPFRAKRAGGQTNRNYVVSFQAKKFFVRLPWESVLDRKTEGKNILALSRNKKVQRILPKYFIYVLSKKNILNTKNKTQYDLPDGTMVTEYIPGEELTMRQFRQKKYQQKLAKLFYTFHTSRVKFVNTYNVFRDEIAKYRGEASKHQLGKLLNSGAIQELRNIEKKAEKELKSTSKGVSTHNDFLLQNLIVDKNNRIYLLDFEYAGFNKKGGIFYDLGYVFRDSFFNPPRIQRKTFERFLSVADKIYKKKLDRSQIYWAVITALLVGIWWGVLRYSSVPKKERAYFRRYIQRGTQGALRLSSEIKKGGARI